MLTHKIKIFLSASIISLITLATTTAAAQPAGTSIIDTNYDGKSKNTGWYRGKTGPNDGMLSDYFVSINSTNKDTPPGYDELIKTATQSYNDGKYTDAVLRFNSAIQLAPWLPEAYRNLARAYFYLSEYPTAAYYYNIYLNSQDLDRSKVTDANDVQSEFQMSLSNIPGEALPIENPKREGYKKEYKEFMDSLAGDPQGDPKMNKPASTYKALLSANFATPELIAIRNRLANTLAVYIHTQLLPPVGSPTPHLTLDDLRSLSDRVSELRTICINPKQLAWADQQQVIIKAIQAVATRNITQAYTYLDTAIEKNPKLTYLIWYKIALLFDDKQYDRALQIMDSHLIQESIKEQIIPDPVVNTMRAALQHARGDNIAASQVYWRVVSDSLKKR